MKTKKDYGSCLRCGSARNKGSIKFCSTKCQALFNRESKIKNGTYSVITAKKHLLDTNNECSICKLPAKWNDKPLMMILDHIDGNSENNDLSNLRLVCPNCDSQLDTFKSRNWGKGRHFRRTRYSSNQSY